jgi:hypothetical protein
MYALDRCKSSSEICTTFLPDFMGVSNPGGSNVVNSL